MKKEEFKVKDGRDKFEKELSRRIQRKLRKKYLRKHKLKGNQFA